MPRFNGMGPAGMGPMTGRGMGYCGTGLRRGRFGGAGFGRGFGFGAGGYGAGYGFDRFSYPAGPVVEADEREYMRRRAEALESELAETRRVLDEMGKAEKE